MLLEILDFMDDITGNVVSETIEKVEYKRKQEILNQPANRIALRKIQLVNRVKQCNETLEMYKDTPSLVEIYSRWKKEAIEELELLR